MKHIIIYNIICKNQFFLFLDLAGVMWSRLPTTVDSLLTHTLRWTPRAMGFEGVWGLRIVLKIDTKNLQKKITIA
jgi:hypothetical protein